VGEQERDSFADGVLGAFVVSPRLGGVVAVEGLPSSQCGRFGECCGERGAVPAGRSEGQQVVDVLDLLAELVKLGEAAELPVESPGARPRLAVALVGEVDLLTPMVPSTGRRGRAPRGGC
jgi:hypothetical protein